MKNTYILSLLLFTFILQSCEDCECIDDDSSVEICEGIFYTSSFVTRDNVFDVDYALDTFLQPIPVPLVSNELDEIDYGLTQFNAFPTNFSTYDQVNDKYVFLYNYDGDPLKIMYIADTNPFNAQSLLVQQDQAAPIFLNGNLYTINLQTAVPNVDFEILQLNQTTGVATQVTNSFATVDGQFANEFLSSATNGIDTIYFLGVKTLISYNVVTNTVQIKDINIPYDANIQTALSGLEYRSTTGELIAIHHKMNSPTAVEQLVVINEISGEITPILNIENILSGANNGSIEFLLNSTTYSACEDTYYITEIIDPETSEPPNSFVIAINLENNTLTEIQTSDFLYGITIDQNL